MTAETETPLARAQRTCRRILTQAGHAEPRVPPFAEVLEVAQQLIAIAGDGTADRRHLRLADAGPIYVTTDAARKYADHSTAGDLDGARLELTAALQDAAATATHGEWRLRRRNGVDIEARVSVELVAGRSMCIVRDVLIHRGVQ